MNHSTFDSDSGFDSHDCIDIIIDGPGDTRVRPCRPELLRLAVVERDKLIKAGQMKPTPLPPHVLDLLKRMEQQG